MAAPLQHMLHAAQTMQPRLVQFVQTLVQTPSPPGHEEAAARLVQTEMRRLGYDDVTVDSYGNVIGQVKGGPGPTLMLNGHIDHVDPGDKTGWPHPPFSGQIAQGHLWGRGSVDMKGPVACMVYAPALLKEMGLTPPGDIYVTAVVMEEVGGVGSSYLATHLKTDLAVVGEPSGNTLRRGHRGRVEAQLTVTGKSIHASVPHLGVNPHYTLANILTRLQTLPMTADETFGPSSVAPTLLTGDQTSPNVTPGRLQLTLDWRNVPAESPAEILQRLEELLQQCLLPGASGSVALASRPFTTYTGITVEQSAVFPSFALPKTHPLVTQARQTLSRALGREVAVDIWQFATDGGHLMAAGIPTVGFGPGDETLAHTNRERISLNALTDALAGYAALSAAGLPA